MMKVVEDINKLDTSKIGYKDIFEIISNHNLYDVVVYYDDEIILVKNLTIDNLKDLINNKEDLKNGTKQKN